MPDSSDFVCCSVMTVLFSYRISEPRAIRYHRLSRHNRRLSDTTSSLGRVEFRIFLILYLVTLALQLITTGSFLRQGTTALVAITAIHAGTSPWAICH